MAYRNRPNTGDYSLTSLPGVILCPVIDYRGRVYDRFHARRESIGRGWTVYGIARNVSATVVMRIARPDKPYRAGHPFNGAVVTGWKRKQDAERVASILNTQTGSVFAEVA